VNPKAQFALYKAFRLVAMVLMFFGIIEMIKYQYCSLLFLGSALGHLSSLFSIRLQSDDKKWKRAAIICPLSFVVAAGFIIVDLDRPKADEWNLWENHWVLVVVLGCVFLLAIMWEFPREYKAMRQILEAPPKV
jgi:formate-dependent nitrite reductase membrane component NrfD